MSPIIITGGAQRLGLAVAKDLLNKGYDVLVTYRRHRQGVDELQALGGEVVQLDFAEEGALQRFVDHVNSTYQTLRGIIHNASDWGKEADTDSPETLFNNMMHIHARVPYQLNLALAEQLQEHPGTADIIHMTDYVQDIGSSKHIAYAASKAALHNLTLSFAQKLAPRVKVNSIAPALLMFNDHDDQEYKAKALKKSLLETCPGPGEAVEAVNYLLNSQYITGRCLHLDGGRHLKN